MAFENIVFEQSDGIAKITINRPKALNALNKQTLLELQSCLAEVALNTAGIRSVIITGSGEKSFVAGADISYMQPLDPAGGKTFASLGHKVMAMVENLPQPVIAAVNGFALGGGCELAISCDIRYASDNAKFGQPEVNLGVIPGFGGTQRLPRLIGKGLANELLFSGKMIDSAEAERIGLVNRVYPQEQLMEESMKLAAMIASRGPGAVRLCKESVNNGMEMDLNRGCAYETDLFALCFADEEQQEGMSAFLEKRSPKF
ncbi:enoyl-CoA hydratase-related protein [Desulforhopalus singaporensis]|uniref:Enoyl-CoA hydratase n=1 Tax=Desulforhopalus singaporensis TaxID=91360 RepID=A0A1H0P1T8_9BACT|nr:enoyl-CoA hydratase-related protein [Desulforhopalus singaporensis]SDO98883.1 enoyl-CoA hydratase [Desulforhopalus singaporensis]